MWRRVMVMLVSAACMSVMTNHGYAEDMGPCEPRDQLFSRPTADNLNSCLRFIRRSLGREETIDGQFTNKILRELLPATEEDIKRTENLRDFDIDYSTIVEIISLQKSEKLINRYIDFIILTTGSADELRSLGLGQLYTYEAPTFLKLLSAFPREKQDIVINNLAWGLANKFYPHLTKENYRRMIVGVHWEILNKSYPYRSLAERIEKSVLKIL